MARLPRLVIPGLPHHVTRGIMVTVYLTPKLLNSKLLPHSIGGLSKLSPSPDHRHPDFLLTGTRAVQMSMPPAGSVRNGPPLFARPVT